MADTSSHADRLRRLLSGKGVLLAAALIGGSVLGATLVVGHRDRLGRAVSRFASVIGIKDAFASIAVKTRGVSSAEDLRRALENAPDGTVIVLATGRYPSIAITNIRKTGSVTVTSADPANPAVIGRLLIRGSAGIILRNIELAAESPAIPEEKNPRPDNADRQKEGEEEGDPARKGGGINRFPYMILQSERITLDHMIVHGPSDNLEAAYRIPAMMVRSSRQVTISNSRFSALQHGLAMLDLDGMSVLNNEFSNIRTDGVRGGDISNAEIAGNIFTNFHPAPGDHPDAIQLWSTPKGVAMMNINIHDNLVVRGAGYPTQGVFLRDVKNGRPFQNITIQGNLVMGGLYNGIAINGVQNGRILDNAVLNYPDRKASWIRVENSGDIEVRNNRASRYIIRPGQIKESDNKIDAASGREEASRVNKWLDAKAGRRRAESALLTRLTSTRGS